MLPMTGLFMLNDKEFILAGWFETLIARFCGKKHVLMDFEEEMEITYYTFRNCNYVWNIEHLD